MEMQIKRNSDAFAVARRIVSEGGITDFWRGNLMNLIRVTPHKVTTILRLLRMCQNELQVLVETFMDPYPLAINLA